MSYASAFAWLTRHTPAHRGLALVWVLMLSPQALAQLGLWEPQRPAREAKRSPGPSAKSSKRDANAPRGPTRKSKSKPPELAATSAEATEAQSSGLAQTPAEPKQAQTPAEPEQAQTPAKPEEPQSPGLSGVLNINEANAQLWQILPGIGPKLAARILAARGRRPFTRVNQLRRVRGIGPKLMRRLRPHLRLQGPSTLRRVPRDRKASP